MKNQAQEPIMMETGDNLRLERKRLLRTILRNIVAKSHELGQPILVHIPNQDIPDTPLEEFEGGLTSFFRRDDF
jgi:hypothetical protein